MKKPGIIISIFLAVFLVFTSSCKGSPPPATAKIPTIRLVGTIGPLSIPLAYLVEHNSLAAVAEKTILDIWANPTQLQAIITGGQGDFVSLPTNSAAIFYNKGISLQLLDTSIWNILYLVTSDTTIKSITDLRGKRVVVPYQGAVPDAMFQFVLERNNIDPSKDVNIFYAPDPVQASQLLLSGEDKYALLSEPSATSVILKGQSIGKVFVRALNMKTEWQQATAQKLSTPVAGMVVLGPLKDRPDVINTFLTEYEKAISWMLANPVEAGNVVNQSHSAHLGTHSLKHTGTEPVLFTKRVKVGKKLVFGVLEFDKNGQEDLLVFFIPGEQETCKFIQSLNPGDFSDIKLNLGAWHNFHPTL